MDPPSRFAYGTMKGLDTMVQRITTALVALALGGCVSWAKMTPGQPISVQRTGRGAFFIQNNQVIDWDSMREELERHDRSRDDARSANRWLLGGGVIFGVGLGTTVGTIGNVYKRDVWPWTVAGVAVTWGGLLIFGVAHDRMASAVGQYNAMLKASQSSASASVLLSPWIAAVEQRDARACPVAGFEVRF
jgi:hypothetical protein